MWVSFNQDGSCLVSGDASGFKVYNCAPFGQFYASNDGFGVGCAEMLFSTSLVAVSGAGDGSPRKLRIANTRKEGSESVLCELTFPASVRRIRMNRRHLAVVLDTQLYLYDVSNMRLLRALDTADNRIGLAAIPYDIQPGADFVCYPANYQKEHSVTPVQGKSTIAGDVAVFDCKLNQVSSYVHAHKAPLAALELSSDGTLLATASTRGTIVRVFSLPSGRLIHEFRRGSSPTRIYGLAFSFGARVLCVSSANMTVHIYKLDGSGRKSKSWLNGESCERSFAWFKLPLAHGTRTVLALSPLTDVVLVAAETGVLFHYKVDMDLGGECAKLGEYTL